MLHAAQQVSAKSMNNSDASRLATLMPIRLLSLGKKYLRTVIVKMLFRRSIAFAHAVSDWAKSESKAKGGSCA